MSDSRPKYLHLGEAELFAELYQIAFEWGTTREIHSLEFIWKETLGSKPRNVCEIGSGTGRFCIKLSQAGFHCLAVEPDPSMLRVLRRNQRRLVPEVAERLSVIGLPFEQLQVKKSFDAIIAMTDTASYFWPVQRLRKLLETSRQILAPKGVLILDVGLWGPGISKSREESWMAVAEDGYVKAHYFATLLETGSIENSTEARREELSFEGEFQGEKVQVSRASVLHALTYNSICNLCKEAGFQPQLRVIPGTRKSIADRNTSERLMLAFSIVGEISLEPSLLPG